MSVSTTAAPVAAWQGSAQLIFRRCDRNPGPSQTLPVATYAKAPLRLQKPLSGADGVCQSVLVHTAGGMVGGDQLQVAATLEPHSQALITTAAAAKIYRSTGPIASLQVNLQLQENTCLEWFPQEAILFNGARYHQNIRVDLAAGALWLGWDIMRFGRSARGEQFQQGEMRSHIEIWQQGRPLWLDRQFLPGGSAVLTSPHGLAGHPVVATLALVGRDPDPQLLEKARHLWDNSQPGDVGVTQLQSGFLCRYRGPSSQQARRWFMAIWRQLRPTHLGHAAIPPRVWIR